MTRLHVEQSGASALVEDLGRPGLAHLGVATSGALELSAGVFDRFAAGASWPDAISASGSVKTRTGKSF